MGPCDVLPPNRRGSVFRRFFASQVVIVSVLIATAGCEPLNGEVDSWSACGIAGCVCYESVGSGDEATTPYPPHTRNEATHSEEGDTLTDPPPNTTTVVAARVSCAPGANPYPWLCAHPSLMSLSLAVDHLTLLSLQCLHRLGSLTINGLDYPGRGVIEAVKGCGEGLTNCSSPINDPYVSLTDIASSVEGLGELHLTGLALVSLPWESLANLDNLTRLSITHSDITNPALAVSMPQLEELEMTNDNLTILTANALHGLWSIKVLNFSHNDLTEIDAATFDPIRGNLSENETTHVLHIAWFNLFTLDLSHNNLSALEPALFRSPIRNVRQLLLGYNHITQLPRYSVEDLHSLQRLELQHNDIYWLDVGTFTNNQLRYLDLSHNKLKKIISMTFLYLPSVERVDLSHNELNFIYKYSFYRTCKKHRHVTVDVSHNHLQTDVLWTLLSSFQHVLKGGQCPVDIDLTYNRMTHVIGEAVSTLDKYLQEEDYNYFRIWKLVRFNISENPLTCDCEVYNEIQLLRSLASAFSHRLPPGSPVDFWQGLQCQAPASVTGTDVGQAVAGMKCPVTTQCPKSCRCVTEPSRGVIHVDCSYQRLHAFPTSLPPGLKELHLAGNHISYIPHRANLDNVTLIDLSHNQMTSLRPAVWEVFSRIPVVFLHRNRMKTLPHDLKFDSEVKQVTLHGNPFRCTCTEPALREILRNNSDIISDVEKVKCNTGEVILDLDDSFFLCSTTLLPVPVRPQFNVASFTFATILAIGFILATVGFLLRRKIALLFRRKLGGYQVHADNDSYKRYDMFILFSDFDSMYVSEAFLPQIQERAPCYRLCVPQRDWRASASVSDNMINSAESSKCIVVVLSNNFLDTTLTCTEYYTALVSVLQNASHRTCFVCLEDVEFGTRYPQFRAALQRHRMFKADDILFWETLFHFIPSGSRKDGLVHHDEEYLFDQDDVSLECEKY